MKNAVNVVSHRQFEVLSILGLDSHTGFQSAHEWHARV